MGLQIGVCAPSSMVAPLELQKGLKAIESWGVDLRVHAQSLKRELFFAGSDAERADAVWQLAQDPELDVVWSARGGYGSARILELLEERTRATPLKLERPKLWIGYSDSTALLEFVRTRWGMATLHAEMPGTPKFFAQTPGELKALQSLIRHGAKRPLTLPFEKTILKPYRALASAIRAPLVGGNLSVIVSLIGTPHALDVRDKILFLEDIDESLYRLDRLVTQALSSGAWRGARALVLGEFTACQDRVPLVGGKPLRSIIPTARGLRAVFSRVGERLGIPVVTGLPVGHGPKHCPLPLGAEYELAPTAQGRAQLTLRKWSWMGPTV